MRRRIVLPSIALMALISRTPVWSLQAPRVVESEPNNTTATANHTALGDSITGTISNVSDVDYFALTIPAGRFVRITASDLDVCLIDQDGVTPLMCNDPHMFGHISFPFTTGGRYFVMVMRDQPSAGDFVTGPYGLRLEGESFDLAAGDPVRTRFTLPQNAADARLAAGLHGELYAAGYDRVLVVDPDGGVRTLASDLRIRGNIAVDGFGEVVVAQLQDGSGSLWRISSTGALSQLYANLGRISDPVALAVGPDGDLWVSNDTAIIRLSPTGAYKTHIPHFGIVGGLAVAPSGDVYFAMARGASNCIYVVRGGTAECAFSDILADFPWADMAFDKDGHLFVGQRGIDLDEIPSDSLRRWGRVDVFTPGITAVRQVAHVPHLTALTFVRDPQGNTTSRLVAMQSYSWLNPLRHVVELNGAADRPAGADFAARFFHAALGAAAPAMVGIDYRDTLRITTDAPNLAWTLESGRLPPGVSLSTAGVLQGTATDTGSFNFTVRATSGMRSWFAAGTMRTALADISIAQVTEALLGGPALSPGVAAFLDAHGNNNGILDVGDLRAYLRAKAQLAR